MKEEYLMTGSFGLDVDDWQGAFYDDELPPDWRAASYSTLLRSVMLPEKEWRKAIKQNWIEEVDDQFRFILYAKMSDASGLSILAKDLTTLPDVFAAQLAGVVMKIEPALTESIDVAEVTELSQKFPLCLDVGKQPYTDSRMDEFCDRAGLAAVWYPVAQSEPLPVGNFLVTLIEQETLPEQKEIVSKIGKWMNGQRSAGLFNTNKKDAPVRAQETRILAELMGV